MVGVVVAVGVLMMGVERLCGARLHAGGCSWWLRAGAVSLVQGLIAYAWSPLFDSVFSAPRGWSAEGLGVWGGAGVGYVAITFVYYFWHRARHEVDGLWRWLHQLHHSPQRIEVITSFYKHPLEMLVNGALSSFVLCAVVGLDAKAASIAVLMTGLAELFYHWNIRTPHWVGYIIQRPESHRVHHQRGLHRSNYSDLPLWDMLFGTFDNPRDDSASCGFAPHQEARVGDMLLGRDVTAREAT